MNSGIALVIVILSLMVILIIISKTINAVKVANNGRPYNPPMQMFYKDGLVHFKKGSQRTAWWITFWDVI